MPGYISEFVYYGEENYEFIEIALPAGTDPSGYSIQTYDAGGNAVYSWGLGTSTGTMGGYDVYVIDANTPGFLNGDSSGNLYADDAISLVDGSGNVEQFISWGGNSVTANSGPASGMTSTSVGSTGYTNSLQSDDGGATYYEQSSTNSGTIPACYARGTQILTDAGYRGVETLKPGDRVQGACGGLWDIRWIWAKRQTCTQVPDHAKPVLIKKDALGVGRPDADLVVSGDHRIAVGQNGQLTGLFTGPCFVPAKALVSLPGIRMMQGKKTIDWHHMVCRDHVLIVAQNTVSESMLLGPQALARLRPAQRVGLGRALGRVLSRKNTPRPALPCLTVAQTRAALSQPVA